MAPVGVVCATAADPPSTSDLDALGWERLWAPYDEQTYRQVLEWLDPADTVLEIGAGDLRLARQIAARARCVYAIEIDRALVAGYSATPGNLTVILGDAYRVPFPAGITAAVLLMRHCQGFGALLDKARRAGCRRLITNARWRVGLELVDLGRQPVPYPAAGMGWYACRCGATGFVPGPAEALTPLLESAVHEVVDCPACSKRRP